ncbi:MAG: glycine C-acetyltransferase [Bacteroidota bacterium]|nr:glycine C-acetyltransferase [Bacteroidota bacterium]MDP4234847.1 glycine C-acetyltransferase [Bacteroidota bacterium]
MYGKIKEELQKELQEIKNSGLYKEERIITTPQGVEIKVEGKPGTYLNFCANNYLGLSSHPRVIKAAHEALDKHGYGMSSVRFICGTEDLHKDLEREVSQFLKTDDTILYVACFDANGGVFEPFFQENDGIISDELNHASIIDGVRLSKAQRFRYKNSNMEELENILKGTQNLRRRIIVTDGVFSMDGFIAKLDEICDLAEKYEALVMVDDSHATGFIGKTGRGSIEYRDVMGRVDIITSTLGKALGGAAGGFTSGRKEIIDMLRQRSRPYLFSNSLPPAIAGAALEVIRMLEATTELRDKLEANTKYFREKMTAAGFDIKPGVHPITPIMLYDAPLAQQFAADLLDEGIYVIGFFYPVVAKGQARIRVQISAAHERAHLDKAIAAFTKIGKKLGVLK